MVLLFLEIKVLALIERGHSLSNFSRKDRGKVWLLTNYQLNLETLPPLPASNEKMALP